MERSGAAKSAADSAGSRNSTVHLIKHVRFELPLLGLLAKAAEDIPESSQRPFHIVLLNKKFEKSARMNSSTAVSTKGFEKTS